MQRKNILKLIVLCSTLLVVLIGFLVFHFSTQTITGEVISQNNYSYTKALCDDNNFCEDYVIECKGEEVESIFPTGFTVQHSQSWQDPRTQEEINKLCE